ncbi:Serine carboxypeptidase protein [Thalictrum thalictroides]|uniref:Serine carboxypeptidase protein n=1 Tax=Thalictrum thalictroides TaxID=46969 RepID=A0A7J6WZU2_THATH|nr:Serine carboxypeptidase protein [Thalictrum thalictroides]
MGILSDELHESAKKNCRGEYVKVDPNNVLQAVSECTAKLNPSHILEPSCGQVWTPTHKEIIRDRNLLEKSSCSNIISLPPIPLLKCRNYGPMLSNYWENDDSVRKALNVRKW